MATVTVDNQAKLNILNSALIEQLTDHFLELAKDKSLRVVVLRGAGEKAFIGGADIREMGGLNPETARAFITRLHNFCESIRHLPVPVIARIQGYCLGGGLEVAISCDMRVAAEGSLFGMPEVKVGIPSIIEAALLPPLIGWGRTRQFLLTAENIGSEKALAWGLVERVVPASQLDKAVEEWIEGILSCGPIAIRHQKELIRKWEELIPHDAIQIGIDGFARAFETDEPTRLMQEFLNKKKK